MSCFFFLTFCAESWTKTRKTWNKVFFSGLASVSPALSFQSVFYPVRENTSAESQFHTVLLFRTGYKQEFSWHKNEQMKCKLKRLCWWMFLSHSAMLKANRAGTNKDEWPMMMRQLQEDPENKKVEKLYFFLWWILIVSDVPKLHLIQWQTLSNFLLVWNSKSIVISGILTAKTLYYIWESLYCILLEYRKKVDQFGQVEGPHLKRRKCFFHSVSN